MAGRRRIERFSSTVCSTASVFSPFSSPPLTFPITILTYTDRLYLGSYAHTPNADTVFPYPEPQTRGSPTKRSRGAVEAPVAASKSRQAPYYFTVDDTLLYNAFHHDFGPLHIGHLYRFALQFHDVLGAKENESRPIVFWSRADPKCTCRLRILTLYNKLTLDSSSSQRCLHARVLHGLDSIMASPSSPSTHRPG